VSPARGAGRAATPRGLARAGLAAGLAVLALAASGLPAAAAPAGAVAPAAAAPAADPLTVAIARVTPAALGAASPLTVKAVVRNAGTSPVSSARVTLRLSPRLTTRAEVATWAQGGDGSGYREVGQVVQLTKPLPANAAAPVTLSVPAGQLGLDPVAQQPEPHGLEVHVDAPAAAGGLTARARSFVVWQPRPVDRPVQLTLLAPVNQPVAAADAGSASALPAAAWSPSGRLSRLLQATNGSGFSYALDPALLSAATAAAGTTPPATASPSPSAGTSPSPSPSAGAATAERATTSPAGAWLQLLGTATRHRDVVALPWADPDVAAVGHGDGPELVDAADAQSRTTVTSVLRRPTGTLLWPVRGRLDTRTLHALTTQADRPVLLDGAALPPQALDQGARVDLAVTGRRKGVRVVRAVLSDPALDTLVATGGASAVPQVLADLAVTAAASPGRSVLVTAPRGWDPDPAAVAALSSALKSAGWVSMQSFSVLAGSPAAGGTRTLPVTYTRTDLRRELPRDHVAAVAVAQRRLTAFAPALAQPERVVPTLQQQALSLLGLGWRGREAGALAVARTPLTAAVDGLYSGIFIEPGSPKNLLATEGSLPISVRSTLSYDVNVLLVLTPRTGQLAVPAAYPLHLEAGRSEQVKVPVKAVANGDVAVVASFRTPDDRTILVTESRDIEVRVRSDWEGRGVLIIAVLLGLLLVVGLARGVRRGRPRIPPEAVPDPDDVGRVPVPEPGDPPAAAALLDPQADADTVHADRPDADRPDAERTDTGAVDGAHGEQQHALVRAVAEDAQEQAALAAVPVSASVTAPTVAATVSSRTVVTASAGAGTEVATLARADLGEPGAAPAPAPPRVAAAAPSAVPPVASGRPPRGRHVGSGSGTGGAAGGSPKDQATPVAEDTPQPPDGPATQDAGGIVSSSAVMAAGTLMSRVLGMVRVVVLAWAIGAAFSANAFSTANTLPNSLFLLIGGGVLNAVLVPQIVRAMHQPDGGRAYVDRLLTLSLAVLAAATLVVTVAAPLLVRLYLATTWTSQEVAVAVAFAFWCLPQVFFYGLYTVLGQVLNARGSFGPYMWAPVVNNVVAIVGMVVFVLLYGSGTRPAEWWSAGAIAVLAGTATLGVVAQALVLVPVLRRVGFRWRLRWGLRGVGLRAAGQAAGWTFAALVVGQLGLLLLSRIANRAGQEAGVAGTGRFVYDTAFLLFMLPHSLVAVSVVTAVFTRMSQSVVAGRLQDVRADLSVALRTTGVATVLATVAFAVLGSDLTALLFATNNRATTEGLAWTTTAMVVGLVAFSAQYLFQRVFYAFGDARTPFWVQVLVVAVWSAGNLLAGWRLEGAWVVVGIGASMSVANILGVAVTVVLVRRRVGGVDGRRVASLYGRCALAAVPAGALAWATSAAAHLVAGEGSRGALAALVSGALVLVVLYFGGLKLLRVRELDDLAAPLRRLVRA
jgi:putative peptidoglycan lipid II flippase